MGSVRQSWVLLVTGAIIDLILTQDKSSPYVKMTKFVFYSKSADKKPGKGTGEELSPGADFSRLARIPHWRKQLSNMSVSPFELGGKRYLSVENFFHAAKFLRDHPDFAATFASDGGVEWSRDPFVSKQAGKAGRVNARGERYKNKRLSRLSDFPNATMRSDFYTGIDRKAMTLALYSKFSQNVSDARILLLTGDAQLYHLITVRGQKSVYERWEHLERVRDCIRLYPPVVFDKAVVDKVLGI